MKCLDVLPLNTVMIDYRIFVSNNFCDSVGEAGAAAQANIAFDQRDLAVLVNQYQGARMGNYGLAFAGGDEQQVNRCFYDCISRNVHERAVFEEGGIERGKGLCLVNCMAC